MDKVKKQLKDDTIMKDIPPAIEFPDEGQEDDELYNEEYFEKKAIELKKRTAQQNEERKARLQEQACMNAFLGATRDPLYCLRVCWSSFCSMFAR